MTNARDFNLTHLDAELDETDRVGPRRPPDRRRADETDDLDDAPERVRRRARPRGRSPTGEQDLAERYLLRRVAGLSTELEDISEVEYRQLRLEKVVLVGVWTEGTVADAENSMAELALLAETAGSEVLDAIYQRRSKPDPATYIGRGKVDGLARDRGRQRRRHRDPATASSRRASCATWRTGSRSRSSTAPR